MRPKRPIRSTASASAAPAASRKRPAKAARAALAALMAAVLLLSGCGTPSSHTDASSPGSPSGAQPGGPGDGADAGTVFYQPGEKMIPDPKADFENNPENRGKNFFTYRTDEDFKLSAYADAPPLLSPMDSFCADGKLYLLYTVCYAAQDGEPAADITGSFCVAVLEPPYEQWEYFVLSAVGLLSDPSILPVTASIAGASDGGLYLVLGGSDVGFLGFDGTNRPLEGITLQTGAAAGSFRLYPDGASLYALFPGGGEVVNGSFAIYDEQLNPSLEQNLENRIVGAIPQDAGYFWYGFDSSGYLTIWDKPNGKQLFQLGDMVGAGSDFLLTGNASGTFALADVSGVWTGDGSAPLQKTLSFADMGYVLQEVLSVSVSEDGKILLLAYLDGNLCLLDLKQTQEPDKQVITIVSDYSPLENVVTAFNRQSKDCFVTLVNPYASGDIDTYREQLQLQISSGKGPDLIAGWLLDQDGCIRNGYLEPLDDCIVDASAYWPACLENQTDGRLFGITYSVLPSVKAVSESLAGNLESWNMEQLMELVENSPAESLQMEYDGLDIVLQYGLANRENPQFIDYSAGKSYLDGQLFTDFLEFAKKYGDDLYYSAEKDEAAEYYRDGKIAVCDIDLYTPGHLLFASACFQGQETIIGMPVAQGSGVYLSSWKLCLNSSSKGKEYAKEFLRYLISEEGQRNLFPAESALTRAAGFSCRRDVTEMMLDAYQKSAAAGDYRSGFMGTHVDMEPLSEEQILQFWAVFEDAKPEWSCPSELTAIFCEELEPYFAGDLTAVQAAGNLHSRVQLYFDEQN